MQLKHYEPGNPKPELVIGLAGPVGTNLREAAKALSQELGAYKYHTIDIRVSQLLHEWCSSEIQEHIANAKEDQRVHYLMNAGDALRNQMKSGAAPIPLVTSAIRRARQQFLISAECEKDHDEVELYNHCFIINSLKHPDEVNLLRKIYGNKFIMVSVILSQDKRLANLRSEIAKSYDVADDLKFTGQVEALVAKDRRRPGNRIGQNISGTFYLADFFMRSGDSIRKDACRLLRAIFGHPNITPTKNEFVMFEARSNALRSADLSRQVGAVITNRKLEIISRGCNEVPVPSGDTYWPEEEGPAPDTRDYAERKDFNAIKKIEVLDELLEFLTKRNAVYLHKYPTSSELVEALVSGELRGEFRELRMSNLIEFGRMVHAEMFALMEAARRGLSVDGGTLYCTTFPCHMCARHIIAAGIREVVYIEPYPKSMTEELYKDMIEVDADQSEVEQSRETRATKVYFQPFHGIAPRIYAESFTMPRRKDEKGYALGFDETKARPKWISLSKSHLTLEVTLSQTLGLVPIVTNEELVLKEE